MNTLILDGSHAGDPVAPRLARALQSRLPAAEMITVREQKIGNCAGDFYCWIRNPGVCNVADDNRLIAAKIARSDLLVYLTPVTFGGYSSALKRMVDHQVQNISPYFTQVQGETHHQKRYAKYPCLLAVGWAPGPDAQAEAVFRRLVHRNAINLYARTAVSAWVTASQSEADLAAQAGAWLEAISRGKSAPEPALPGIDSLPLPAAPPRRAVLLVGSPRTRKSTSASLGGYLMEQLAAQGLQTETLQLYPAFASPARARAALETLDSADLVVLAFPLYVDSLPAPVIAALEQIAAHRAGRGPAGRLAAIANCGFPEAGHNATALAICATFARQAGLSWAGSLALGGGEGLVHGAPLKEMDGRAVPLKQALDQAALALAQGQAIPPAAQALWDRPFVPGWMYRLFSGFGWKQQARQYGVHGRLRERPYAP